MNPAWRERALNLLRITLSVSLLGWILANTGLDRLANTLQAADAGLYAVAVGIALFCVTVRAVRWQVLLRAVGVRLPLMEVARLYYIGAFFNTFLPTGFGGDVVRVLEIGPQANSNQATGTVVVDRLTGFIALFMLALLALPFAASALPLPVMVLVATAGLGVMGGSALLFEGRVLRALTRRLPRALSLAGDGWLGRTYAVITACGWRAIARAIGVSLVFNALMMLAAWLIARALAIPVAAATLIAFVPLATTALLLPISISGLGVREGIFITLFATVGVSDAQAVAFSLGYYVLDLVAGVMGGVVYLLSGVLGLSQRKTP